MSAAGPSPLSLLAFDYGLRHIGVAVGQRLISSASPLVVIKARDGVPDWQHIEKIIREWQPDLLLVGLPLHMDGTDSPMSGRARKFARQLEGRFNKCVDMVDERLSSFAAKQDRREHAGDLDFGSHTVDAEAAVIILQDWYRRDAWAIT
ncbi:MAG TPA: Holliday junction resolvase RuvX [Pseudomonadales bacterium]|nr:Holliday junction resolvase RuvX [Pseudomonadales bacterium]